MNLESGRSWILATLIVGLLTLPLASLAQRGVGFRASAFGNVAYNGRFTFSRIRYGGGGFRGGASWAHDYPRADEHLSALMQSLTALNPNVEGTNVFGGAGVRGCGGAGVRGCGGAEVRRCRGAVVRRCGVRSCGVGTDAGPHQFRRWPASARSWHLRTPAPRTPALWRPRLAPARNRAAGSAVFERDFRRLSDERQRSQAD